MILDKEIKVKIRPRIINHYSGLGYVVEYNKIISVKTIDLTIGSNIKINVKCDVCDKEKLIKYCDYIKNTKNLTDEYCCCEKCAVKKINKTKFDRYGKVSTEEKKEYQKKYNIEYNKIHKEEIKEKREKYFKKYYKENKKEISIKNKLYIKEYREKHKEERKTYCKKNIEKRKLYLKKNKDKIKKQTNKYYQENKEKIYEYYKNRKKTNQLFRLSCKIRRIVNRASKNSGYIKKSRTHQILGCSFEEFRLHLEKQFLPWMSWDNYGSVNGNPPTRTNQCWDIDHIIRLNFAKTEEDLFKLNHYTNLQPLCSYVNRYIKR